MNEEQLEAAMLEVAKKNFQAGYQTGDDKGYERGLEEGYKLGWDDGQKSGVIPNLESITEKYANMFVLQRLGEVEASQEVPEPEPEPVEITPDIPIEPEPEEATPPISEEEQAELDLLQEQLDALDAEPVDPVEYPDDTDGPDYEADTPVHEFGTVEVVPEEPQVPETPEVDTNTVEYYIEGLKSQNVHLIVAKKPKFRPKMHRRTCRMITKDSVYRFKEENWHDFNWDTDTLDNKDFCTRCLAPLAHKYPTHRTKKSQQPKARNARAAKAGRR